MNVVIFGGSFDPVHFEHVRLAQAAVEALHADKLIVVPAGVPPHKKNRRLASAEDRIAMCKAAFAGVKNAEVSDYEVTQEGASYTYLTCRHFAAEYPGATLYLAVGTDMFYDFFSWKNPDDILSNATLAVCRRAETVENTAEKQAAFYRRFSKNFAVIPYNGAQVSSGEIRARIALGLAVDSLVPPAVAAYIEERGLYRSPLAEAALALEKPARAEHSKRVCLFALKYAEKFHLDKDKAFLAAVLHDVAKNLPENDAHLNGFIPPKGVPMPVLHQFSGAYVAEHTFGVKDEDVLNAVRFHTSGRAAMSDLEKLIFCCDMTEEGRSFDGVKELRDALDRGLDECTRLCLERQIQHLEEQGGEIYPLTEEAYEYYKNQIL